MAKHTISLLLLTWSLALPGSATAQDRHGITFAPPATYAEMNSIRPRGLFFADTDDTLDYNSYSYDDRYHGPAPFYGSRGRFALNPQYYYYSPGTPLYRPSTGGVLYYWQR
jgi:hypothetical protein